MRSATQTPLTIASALLLAAVVTVSAHAETVTTKTGPPTQQAPMAGHHASRHHRHAQQRKVAAIAPLHAQPPAGQPTTAPTTAPTPNEWVTAPPDRSGQETSVAPTVMQIHYPPMGDGYTTGSSAQAMDDREAAKVTGVQVKVPLGQ